MSNIDLVLLGLIKQKSQSAYDIKKNGSVTTNG